MLAGITTLPLFLPALAAVFASATGIIGAAPGKVALDGCRIADPAAGWGYSARRRT